MAPGEEVVEIPYGSIELVIFLGSDDDHLRGCSRRADHGGKIPDLFVAADSLAILNPRITEMPGEIPVEIDPGDYQRAKEIPLPTFIDPKVRLELFR